MKIIKVLQPFLVAILKQKSWFTNCEFFAAIDFYGLAISGVNKKFNFTFWPKTAKIGSSEDKLHVQQYAQNTWLQKFLMTILVLIKFAIKKLMRSWPKEASNKIALTRGWGRGDGATVKFYFRNLYVIIATSPRLPVRWIGYFQILKIILKCQGAFWNNFKNCQPRYRCTSVPLRTSKGFLKEE